MLCCECAAYLHVFVGRMLVSAEPDCNIARAIAWACETEGGQPDG